MNPDHFIHAAELVDDGWLLTACPAVAFASASDHRSAALRLFTDIFIPPEAHHSKLWWPADDKQSRVIALCLAAAIVDEGDHNSFRDDV